MPTKFHPEQMDDEIYMGNAGGNVSAYSSWTSIRYGKVAYCHEDGKLVEADEVEGMMPWFIKRSEVEERLWDHTLGLNAARVFNDLLERGAIGF